VQRAKCGATHECAADRCCAIDMQPRNAHSGHKHAPTGRFRLHLSVVGIAGCSAGRAAHLYSPLSGAESGNSALHRSVSQLIICMLHVAQGRARRGGGTLVVSCAPKVTVVCTVHGCMLHSTLAATAETRLLTRPAAASRSVRSQCSSTATRSSTPSPPPGGPRASAEAYHACMAF
jgi:hypothetical protein